MSECVCGHDEDEHGHDDEHPGSTACAACDDDECIAFEAVDNDEPEESEPR